MNNNDQMILWAFAGGLFLILAILSSLVLGISCAICRIKGPSTIGALGISILLVALFLGAMYGAPMGMHEAKKMLEPDAVASSMPAPHDIKWLNASSDGMLALLKMLAIYIGISLPVLILVDAILFKLFLKSTGFSKGLLLGFVYLFLFGLAFLGAVYGFILGWQALIASS